MAGHFLCDAVTSSCQILAIIFYDKMEHDSNTKMRWKRKTRSNGTKRNVCDILGCVNGCKCVSVCA